MEAIKQDYSILTVREAADYLRVSEMTILRLANQGVIPGAKIGRQWRFPRESVLNLIGQNKVIRQVKNEAGIPVF